MTNEQHDMALALFDEALELDPEARPAFLQERCGHDKELHQAVQEMLSAHSDAQDFLEPPMPAAAMGLLAQFSDAAMVGAAVGPYTLVDMIASGGMGTVFKAVRRNDPDKNPVAVKLIRQGMDTRDIVRRFHHERATLAELQHPNIAALIDGGVSDAGQPYLVMEFVDGTPIDEHCDENRLGVRERLELMRTVCQAVQHAHQNLVVHRDLKPSNILVTSNGTPKLVDFGIAKLLQDDRAPRTRPMTATGFRIATPQYASPELISGEPITTAVDVYSLGLVMYELLTGHRPYNVQHKPPHEIQRLICDIEPEKPSTAITRDLHVVTGDGTTHRMTPEELGKLRRTSLMELSRTLRGDLDTVVLTAMHKDPKRRYASVEQLAQDIDRFLTGFPVKARKDSFLYRTGKLIRRNRVAALAMLAVLLSLLGGATAATLGLVQARKEADRARTEAAKAQRVTAFLRDMLAAGDPEIGSADMRVRDVLDQAAARLETELAAEPRVLADALGTIGETYHSLGLPDQALPVLRRALSIHQSLGEGQSAETAEALIRLGRVLRTSGELEEAKTILEQATAIHTEQFGPNSVQVATALNAVSGVLLDLSHHADAVRVLREALAIYQTTYPGDHIDTADTMEKLGVTLALIGRPQDGEPYCRDALAMNLRLFDQNHPRISHSRRRLAIVLHQGGKLLEAEPLYRRALESDLEVLGGKHPNVSRVKNNLGLLLASTGRQNEGEQLLREALDLRRRLFGNEHPAVVSTLNNIATLLDATRAEPLLRESLTTGKKLFGPDHEHVARASQNLATCLRTLGDYHEAMTLYRDAIRIIRAHFGQHHTILAYALLGLGEVLTDLDRVDEAEPLLRESLEIHKQKHADSANPDELIAKAQSVLGYCLLRRGELQEARQLLLDSGPQIIANPNEPEHERRRAAQRMVELFDRLNDNESANQYRPYVLLPYPHPGPSLLQNQFAPPARPPIPRTPNKRMKSDAQNLSPTPRSNTDNNTESSW